MSCYVVAHSFRRAERLSILGGNGIAEAECHVLSSWDHATRIIFNQPRILSTQAGHHSIEARREATGS